MSRPDPTAPGAPGTGGGDGAAAYRRLWAELDGIGRDPRSGGHRRFAWTSVDRDLREWFAGAAAARGLDLVVDRAGNQWGWWGDPDRTPGVAAGSHLDSVPDGGAYDGPLGVVAALAAVDALRAAGFRPARPIGVVHFADEEGARFGVACAGSRLLTGALSADRAAALRDGEGVGLAEAVRRAGLPAPGPDPDAVRRIGSYVELHVEQGRGLVDLGAPVGVGTGIRPHGRWRVHLPGEANHAGTTALADRRDPMLDLARLVLAARAGAQARGMVATVGKVEVTPNGVNAIPSAVTAWLDARGADPAAVRSLVAELSAGRRVVEESWTPATSFDPALAARLAVLLGAPTLGTGAGHDAGILAGAGVPADCRFAWRTMTRRVRSACRPASY
nr:Zn-dependent hydrolase [uncultured bacterium]